MGRYPDIKRTEKNGYVILNIVSDLGLDTDLSELRNVINQIIEEGHKKFALSFSENSFLYTPAIAILVECYEMVNNIDGDFVVIRPNEDVVSVLTTIGLTDVTKIVNSEDDL